MEIFMFTSNKKELKMINTEWRKEFQKENLWNSKLNLPVVLRKKKLNRNNKFEGNLNLTKNGNIWKIYRLLSQQQAVQCPETDSISGRYGITA